jgi:hypothetical protein
VWGNSTISTSFSSCSMPLYEICLIKFGLLFVCSFVGIDLATGSEYALMIHEKWTFYTYYFAGLTSFMLASSIGFLFVTQMLTSVKNLTTLESFVEGIYDKNPWSKNDWKENLREIFGSSNWILPTAPFAHDSRYETNELNSVDSL